MSEFINDEIFGKMTYKHSWTRKAIASFWGRDTEVNITAKAYVGDEILQSQRDMFITYEKDVSEVINNATPEIIEYCKTTFMLPNLVNDDLIKALTPRSVLFQRDDSWGILFDCKWDEEHGVAIFIINDQISVGPQDCFI